VLQKPKRGLDVLLADFKTVPTKPSHRAAARGRSSKSTSSRPLFNGHRRRSLSSLTSQGLPRLARLRLCP
jgi:hypothetical protein